MGSCSLDQEPQWAAIPVVGDTDEFRCFQEREAELVASRKDNSIYAFLAPTILEGHAAVTAKPFDGSTPEHVALPAERLFGGRPLNLLAPKPHGAGAEEYLVVPTLCVRGAIRCLEE